MGKAGLGEWKTDEKTAAAETKSFDHGGHEGHRAVQLKFQRYYSLLCVLLALCG